MKFIAVFAGNYREFRHTMECKIVQKFTNHTSVIFKGQSAIVIDDETYIFTHDTRSLRGVMWSDKIVCGTFDNPMLLKEFEYFKKAYAKPTV